MNPGDHLFVFHTREVEWKWAIQPERSSKLNMTQALDYLTSLSDTLTECSEKLRSKKQKLAFGRFGSDLFDFARDHTVYAEKPMVKKKKS